MVQFFLFLSRWGARIRGSPPEFSPQTTWLELVEPRHMEAEYSAARDNPERNVGAEQISCYHANW